MTIQSINQLKELAIKSSEPVDCYIFLNGGLKSSKAISYDDTTNRFIVFNSIDGTEQRLTVNQLNNPAYTNIGKAIKQNALIIE